MIADLLDLEVRVSAALEATAIGIANLAGVSALRTMFDNLSKNWKAEKIYKPAMRKRKEKRNCAVNKAVEALKKFHG